MNPLRKQLVKQILSQKGLQQKVYSNFQSLNKMNQIAVAPRFLKFQNVQKFNFAEEKKAEEKQEEKQEEQQQNEEVKKEEKKEDKLPDNVQQLLKDPTPEALTRAQELHKRLEVAHGNLEKDIQKLKKDLDGVNEVRATLDKKVNDLRSSLKLQIEDSELARQRLTKEKENEKVYSISKFAKELLETCDNLERALDNSKENKDFDTLLEGTQMTYDILMKTLRKFGVEQQNPHKEKFDPNHHEALMQVDDPNMEPGTVAFVIQSGYSIGERNLRPAKVGVVRERSE